jgi:hypothetical protein
MIIPRRSLLAAGAVLLARPALAQQVTFETLTQLMSSPESKAADALLNSSARYSPRLAFARAHADALGTEELQQILALIGDEEGALENKLLAPVDSPGVVKTVAQLDARLAGGHAEDAVAAIVKRARGRRLVFINEAHNGSRCRWFSERVALALRREGFNTFAAESFTVENTPEADNGGPITTNTGFYVADPVFAEMVRGVRAAGYRLAAYDDVPPLQGDPKAQTALREQTAADNLARLLRDDPKARLVVHCGYDHAAKVPQPDGSQSVSCLMKVIKGIDPITVTQAYSIASPRRDNEPITITRVLDKFGSPKAPIAVWDGAGVPLGRNSLAASYDVSVYHHRAAQVDGRPGWRAEGRRRGVLRLASPLPPGAILQAVPLAEARLSPATVPADQYPAPEGANQAVFFLRPGQYEVRADHLGGVEVLGRVTV